MSTDFMTYEDILHNWGLLEQDVVESVFGTRNERTYDHVIKRVSDWIGSRKAQSATPSQVSELYASHKDGIKQFLLSKYIIPSTPILKFGGTRRKNPNYFSYYIFSDDSFEQMKELKSKPQSGIEFGYQFSLSNETEGKVRDALDNMDSSNVGITVREDGSSLQELTKIKNCHTRKNLVYYHEVDLNKVSNELRKGKRYGLTFGQNIKKGSIIPDVLKGYNTTARPGYIGPQDTACPMFYLNLSALLDSSKDYESYLSRVYKAAFFAAILGNVVLFQEEGYMLEKIAENTMKYRPVGVGFLGLHSAMLRCDIDYESEDAVYFLKQTQASLCLGSVSASCEIMKKSSKVERVGCKVENLARMVHRCRMHMEGEEVNFGHMNAITTALEQHGCMYNLVTSVQGYDTHLEDTL